MQTRFKDFTIGLGGIRDPHIEAFSKSIQLFLTRVHSHLVPQDSFDIKIKYKLNLMRIETR